MGEPSKQALAAAEEIIVNFIADQYPPDASQQHTIASIIERHMANRWIPVEEALPETADFVWGYDDDEGHALSVQWLNQRGFWRDGRGNRCDITHWQPLPEPPPAR